jgi:hypothetical protein
MILLEPFSDVEIENACENCKMLFRDEMKPGLLHDGGRFSEGFYI